MESYARYGYPSPLYDPQSQWRLQEQPSPPTPFRTGSAQSTSRGFHNYQGEQVLSNSVVARRHTARYHPFPQRNETVQTGYHPTRQYSNGHYNQQSSTRAASPWTTRSAATSSSAPPHVSFSMLTQMLDKTADEILAEMVRPNFPLKTFLNDKRMETHNDWIVTMTKLFEYITTCTQTPQHLHSILKQIPDTTYVEGVYNAVRQPDPKTNELRFDFLQSFLNMSNRFIVQLPHLTIHLTKVFERIEWLLSKINSNTLDFRTTKDILDKVRERVVAIEQRQQSNQPLQIEILATTTNQLVVDTESDDYRRLPIVPDIQEILLGNPPGLQKNIIDGVYNSPQHYLNTHFRLLREDFVGPLRDGIQQYLFGLPSEKKNYNIRVYENVHSNGPKLNPRCGIVYSLGLDRQMASKISWANSRRLMYGSLLLLTSDNFRTCTFVTVEDREQIETTFCISVRKLETNNNFNQVQVNLDVINYSCPLTMIETTTYFEAYRPVLTALQMIALDRAFPLKQFILKLTNENIPPNYVTSTTTYDFTPLLVNPNSKAAAIVTTDVVTHRKRIRVVGRRFHIEYRQSDSVLANYKSVNLLDSNQWPTHDELHLNPKQHEALMLALTRKVALIQGPPGTGKTYLGVRIVEMLLYNRPAWCPSSEQSTPILMICQTNHALDQFLELIKIRLNLTEGIIRVGSRCKNEAVKPFSLSDARKCMSKKCSIPDDMRHQKSFLFAKKSNCDETLKRENAKIELSRTKILSFSSFDDHDIINRPYLSAIYASYKDDFAETPMLDWLQFDYDYRNFSKRRFYIENMDEELSKRDYDLNRGHNNEQLMKTPNHYRTGAHYIEHNEEDEEEERRRDETDLNDEYFGSPMVNHQESSELVTTATTQRSSVHGNEDEQPVRAKKPFSQHQLVKSIIECPTTLTDETVRHLPDDPWKLTRYQRYDLYRYWLLKYQNYCNDSIRTARREYDQATTALAQQYHSEDYYILKDSIIVAMTTTCAAKYHAVLEKLQSKIVIVEEAAAIFEAHIITALSSKCEHLILIGDHVQLRPNPSVYRLGVKCHLDVSLFERFVRNKFPSVRLNIQHRMRPEIARLMKHFYDDLVDHPSVPTNRPEVRGVESSVFFINHTHMEASTQDESSKRNEFEGNYIVALAKYLTKQGYRPDKITVLVMYLGQRQYIAKLVKSTECLRGLRIMVTDNYQGEENDIILLSLVRSNAEKKIGFLATSNRICVALSRARCGLFVIGNMNLLAEVDDTWKKIVQSLAEKNEIGQGLSLSCRQHPEDKFIADTPESFAKRPRGGCHKQCTSRLKCGHRCELTCHNDDIEHLRVACRKSCDDMLPCGHPCTKRCHSSNPTEHNPCRMSVEKTIAQCGHKITCRCSETPTVNECEEQILKRLSCNHVVQLSCSTASCDKKLQHFSCPTSCGAILSCEHKCQGTCGQCRSGRLHIPCKENCTRAFICSHVCTEPCAANCPPCRRECQVFCVHSKCRKRCSDPCAPCKEACEYRCRHLRCTRRCSQPCDRGPCNEPCRKKLKCGHSCIGMCGEPCPRQCRICDKRTVQEIFFGSEDEPDARFVLLPDCGHLIEVTGLDRFIFDSINNSTDSTTIRFPECPRCTRQIRRCMRYMPEINRVHDLIEQVKKKILGNHSEDELRKQRNHLIKEYENTRANLLHLEYAPIKTLFETLYSDTLCSHEILILMENILIFIKTINDLLKTGNAKLPVDIFIDQVKAPSMHILKYITAHQPYRNFAKQQIQDIQSECERIGCVIVYESLHLSLKQQIPMRVLEKNEEESIANIKHLVTKPGRFTKTNRKDFCSHIEKLKHLDNIPGLGINDGERKAIVSALNMTKGHWYVCPKGHPYVITECGGAMQESNCPECGERIGGQRHNLISTNRHFGTMDQSTYAAWSDEANMNMVPQF